ncbi:MAG: TIGR02147 family protein [Chitinispirillaceae bacterium]|nr:TIGR02147 family protein [Chitinispirillaceae bacterium]
MTGNSEQITIYNYFDYREYLSDVFKLLKKKRYGFSYRSFSKEAGISSHNFLPRIIKRERNLTAEFILLLGAYLKLPAKEIKYFQALVAFNNAKKPSQKEKYLKQLFSLRVVVNEHRIEDKKLHFFEKWYYPVIRELVTICDFQDDFALLARQCIPRISAAQARGAVGYLFKNGFIRKSASGRYEVVDQVIATEPEVDSAIIPHYHKITIRQCADAVDTIRKEDRNISSSTLLVSQELYEELKKEILLFRKRLLSMARECRNPDMVCFAGFQLLPRSETITRQRGEQ